MPWSSLPDPIPPMTIRERVSATLGNLGCVGIVGLFVAALILGYAAMF